MATTIINSTDCYYFNELGSESCSKVELGVYTQIKNQGLCAESQMSNTNVMDSNNNKLCDCIWKYAFKLSKITIIIMNQMQPISEPELTCNCI